jgi:glutamyl-tRNA reductase
MSLISIGINYKTAALDLRSQFAFTAEKMQHALKSLSAQTGSGQAVILSTCNRTEIYTEEADLHHLIEWLHRYHGLEKNALSQYLYHYRNEAVVHHLMRVSCGLDSLVIGEPQILGQLKQAFIQAKQAATISGSLERLFQQTFSTAKLVRTETTIGAMAVSVAYAAVELSKHIFNSLSQCQVLLIGAGETIELAAKHFQEQQVAKIVIANRTLSRAQKIAQTCQGQAAPLIEIPTLLVQSDIVIASTASELPILGKGLVEKSLKQRKHRPIFFVDLAVPRDIEPEVADLDDSYLYTLDDLQHLVERNLNTRQSEALKAEALAKKYADEFVIWLNAQKNMAHMLAFRQQSLDIREQLLRKAKNRLQQGADASEVLVELSHQLTNRLIHAPTKALKQASERGDLNELHKLREVLDIQLELEKEH